MKDKNKYLKIIITFFVIALIGVFIVNILNNKSNNDNNYTKTITPLLYEVTKEGSNNKMYLFGSIHLANNSDLIFPEYIINAYNNSHYIACEYNMIKANADLEKMSQMAIDMMYQDGTTIKDHISNEVYEKLISFLKQKNAYISLYEYYRPIFFYSLMSNLLGKDAKITSEAGIDEYFINKATKDNKTILEVESMEYQINTLLSFSDNLYELTINDEIDNYDENVKNITKLYNSWKEGNLNNLLEVVGEDLEIKDNYTQKQQQEINEFNKKLINDRNQTMTDKAIEYFESDKDVFFMVGTLHIVSEDGLINNLKAKGYNVKQVK